MNNSPLTPEENKMFQEFAKAAGMATRKFISDLVDKTLPNATEEVRKEMKKSNPIKMFVLFMFLFCSTAHAVDFTATYDKYLQPNKGNNYDHGQGLSVGLKHDIWHDLKGHAEFTHLTDIHFPTASDPKGSFGELRGFGGIYSLVFELPYNKNVSFNLSAGAGPVWWNFRENPNFQDHHITVDVDPSIVLKAGVGAEIKIYQKWHVDIGLGWFDTSIGKNVHNEAGESMVLLDAGDQINLRYITYKVGVRKEF